MNEAEEEPRKKLEAVGEKQQKVYSLSGSLESQMFISLLFTQVHVSVPVCLSVCVLQRER